MAVFVLRSDLTDGSLSTVTVEQAQAALAKTYEDVAKVMDLLWDGFLVGTPWATFQLFDEKEG